MKQSYTVTKVENGVSTVIGSGLAVTPPNVGPHTDRPEPFMGSLVRPQAAQNAEAESAASSRSKAPRGLVAGARSGGRARIRL